MARIFGRWKTLAVIWGGFAVVALGIVPQDGRTPADEAEAARRDAIDAIRPADDLPQVDLVPTQTPPEIDGVLDDAVWAQAPVASGFVQVEPVEGAAPTEKTEIRFLYDDSHIYLAVTCFDSEPEKIIVSQMIRDGDFGGEDHISMVFDTFHDRRNAFFFSVNPVGARADGLVEDNGNLNRNFDAFWRADARIVEKGWTAEIAIPFLTLSFDPSKTTWGFNLERTVRRTNEISRWSAARRDLRFTETIAEAGILAEIRDIEQGLGLDIRPFLSLKFRQDQVQNDNIFTWDPGIDIFYKITPQLTAVFTANTDFAEAEVDERRVNLTRFPLFFPEKRDFFLQDAGIFDFGGVRRSPRMFFSRRIGISRDGNPLDILAGLKLTGRVDDLNLGILDIQQSGADGVNGKNLAVARAKLNVLEESSVGIIATAGDPRTNGDNYLGGIDFDYRDRHLIEGKTVRVRGFAARSFSSDVSGDEAAYGIRFSYPNDDISAGAGFTQTQENFNPALGFLTRRGVNEYFANFRYRWRFEEGFIRTVDSGFFFFLADRLDGDVESARFSWDIVTIRSDIGDEIELTYRRVFEGLDEGFEISDGIVVGKGTYHSDRLGITVSTSSARLISGEAEFTFGEFLSGTRMETRFELQIRPSRHLTIGGEFEQNDVHLKEGDFITRLARFRLRIFFTPNVSWNTFIQWDDVSDSMGINSRFRWIIEDGRELFIVVNQGFDVDSRGLRSTSSELAVKIAWTFRF